MCKKVLHLTFIVCVLSLFLYQNVSYAYPSGKKWETAEKDLNNAYKAMQDHQTALAHIQEAMTALNDSWDSNETEIKKGKKVTVDAIAGVAVGVVTAYFTGGGSAIAYLPSIFSGWIAAKEAKDTYSRIWSRDEYLKAMQTTLSAMDTVLGDADAAYTVYTADYAAYLKILAEHSGGLVRFNGNGVTAVYSQDALDMAVNSTPRQTKYWYHSYERPYQNPPADPHTIDPRYDKTTHWTLNDLPKNYWCKGPCSVKFRSAEEAFYEHRTECGTGEDIGIVSTWDIAELQSRPIGQGCGHKYYKCPGYLDREGVQKHEIRTCTRVYTYADGSTGACLDSDGEPLQYRKCMHWQRDHNENDSWNYVGYHSNDGSDSDDEEANAGGTLHACNIHDTSVSGDHSSTWLCNESPCSNRSVPYCLAMCPYTGNHGTTTDSSLVVCDIEGCQDSTSYNPDSSSAGLHAYCNECYQYKCTGGGHSWYPSCSDTTHTNSNGDSCTVGGYECVSHTPVYPEVPAASFDPSLSIGSSSYSPGSTLTVTVSTSGAPIYGAHLYQGNTSLGWFGGSQSTTSVDLSYTFPTGASGSYDLRVSVWPWDGDTYGSVHRLYFTVDVQ